MPHDSLTTVSRFEADASSEMVTMSDGSQIRVVRRAAPEGERHNLSLLFVGGWGTLIEGWDDVTLEFARYFDVLYVETREKASSVLDRKSTHDLSRMSSDLAEVVAHFQIDQRRLVVFGSSWGALVAAHGAATKKLDPGLVVLAAPIAKFDMPPLTRRLVPFLPARVFHLLKPLLRYWLVRRRSHNPAQARVYLRIMDGADAAKWIAVGRHIAHPTYWHLYPKVETPVLIISIEEGDKFHTSGEAHRIHALIPNCHHVSVKSSDELDSPQVVSIVRQHLKGRFGSR